MKKHLFVVPLFVLPFATLTCGKKMNVVTSTQGLSPTEAAEGTVNEYPKDKAYQGGGDAEDKQPKEPIVMAPLPEQDVSNEPLPEVKPDKPKEETTPTGQPQVTPTTANNGTPVPITTKTKITINIDKVLHAANSHILGTNRNHVTGDFPDGAAKLQKMKELTPKWGQKKYLYRIGHGPTDGRNDYTYMTGYHFERVWNITRSYPYDDIREGLKEAMAMGADQMHVVNYGTSTPEEAGRYVSYLNKSTDANRKTYPIEQQNVKIFEIGNEIPWTMVRGHNEFAKNEVDYAKRANLFATAMRQNSDVPIKIGAVASINSNWEGNGWSGGATTVKNIIANMGKNVDFLIYHGYPSWPLYKSGDLMTIMAQNEWQKRKLREEIKPAIKAASPDRDIQIANTEFFTHLYNDVKRSRGMFGTLYAADSIVTAFAENLVSAVHFCFEHKDMADASFFIGSGANNNTAIFKLQKMIAEHWGDEIVESSAQMIPAAQVAGQAVTLPVSRLAYVASRSADKVYVLVVNRMQDADVTAGIELSFAPKSAIAYELKAPDGQMGWDAANGDVKTVENAPFSAYTFKKASITILELSR